jgi:hypothetical protein
MASSRYPGSTSRRGYGWAPHQALRKQLKPVVAMGTVPCCYCGQLIRPGEPWDLAHDHDNGGGYLGPSHSYCNRSEGGRRANGPRRDDDPRVFVAWI